MAEIINSKETELSILGSIMYSPAMFPRIYGVVKPEDFYFPLHRTLYTIMYQLHTANMDINVVAVWNEVKKRGIEDITENELYEFLDYRVNVDVAQTFASQVSEFAGYRTLQHELSNLMPEVKERSRPLSTFISMITDLGKRLSTKGSKTRIRTGKDLIDSWLKMLQKGRGDIRMTGIERIDKHLIDLAPKEITLIAARPGVGKTAMLLQSARLNLEAGKRVGYLSMEMPEASLVHRMTSAISRIDGTVIRNMDFDEVINDKAIIDAAKKVEAFNWYVVDTGPFTNVTVSQIIRSMVYEENCDIVYVDYLQLIGAEGGLQSAKRNDQLTAISRELKNLAMELDIPIVAAAQLNRESTKTVTGRPTIAQLRDSGALEQDASIIAFLYADLEQMIAGGLTEADVDAFLDSQDNVAVKFEIAKQRNGKTFVEDLIFHKPIGTFEEGAKSY